eukprot:1286539-Pyramimonas_sp.AAC.1
MNAVPNNLYILLILLGQSPCSVTARVLFVQSTLLLIGASSRARLRAPSGAATRCNGARPPRCAAADAT